MKLTTDEIISLENEYGAKNYAPLPVVISRGKGALVWDPEGRQYFDFLSGICSVSQGHCHPKIVAALCEQAQQLTMISRAFYSNKFGPFAKFVTQYFGFDRVLVMNTGVEAVETAIKLARKWGYSRKSIPADQAKIIVCESNFHGRTMAAISASTSADSKNQFGPFVPGFVPIPFGDISALAKALEDPTVAAFLVEPIQGEGGVILPPEGYLKEASSLCKQANMLLVADEVQTGIARTGKLIACDHEGVRPDILVLGKALSGGTLPVSAILADNAIMDCFKPGDHGSTFGGNPLACAVAQAALEVIRDEKLAENAERQGDLFRDLARAIPSKIIAEIRGRGLLNAIVLDPGKGVKAGDVCLKLRDAGIITKNTRDTVIRFAPPLVITEAQMREAMARVKEVFSSY